MAAPAPRITPVPRLANHEEDALVYRLAEAPPWRVLVASDLHLCSGRDPRTRVYDRAENFFADEAFGRWLDFYAAVDRQALLVLNGDVVDFTRITAVPRDGAQFERWSRRLAQLGESMDPQMLRRSVGRTEGRYGLRTADFKSVWKLDHVLDGHPGFVAALRRWLSAGHLVLYVKGNHDLEVHWPLVRQAFRDRVCDGFEHPAEVAPRILFAHGGALLANLVLEHGHAHEAMTAVRGEAQLEQDARELRYPLGSFINRYLINPLERIDPFLDNIKPVQQALLAILRRHPVYVLKLYFHGWKFAHRALRMRRVLDGPAVLVHLGLLLPLVSLALIALFWMRSDLWAKVTAALPFLTPNRVAGTGIAGVLTSALMPYIVGGVLEALRALGFMRPRDHLAEGAQRLLQRAFAPGARYRRVYCLMGHTHRQDVQQFGALGREEFYLNTGTWIPLWVKERPDLIGRVSYGFALLELGEDGEYRHRTLVWDDQAGGPREPVLLTPYHEEVHGDSSG